MTEIIKSFDTPKFTVSLIKNEDEMYAIIYGIDDSLDQTEWVDFGTACYLFDSKIEELEGN